MWKLVLVGWKLVPRQHRRAMLRQAGKHAKRHGPSVARAAGRAYRAARTKGP